jgi:hypothetical protein
MPPTIIEDRGVRLVIRTREPTHKGRPHCHAEAPGADASIDLKTFEVLASRGFSRKALERIVEFVSENQKLLLEAWNDYHR